MLQVRGGGKKLRGGHSPSPLSPADFTLGDNMARGVNANYAKMPNAFPSNQVGGDGYGFSSGSEVSPFGGSYAPIARYGSDLPNDLSRGGNNVMSGGRRRKSKSMWRMKGCSSKKKSKGGDARGRGGKSRTRGKGGKARGKGGRKTKKNRKTMRGGNCGGSCTAATYPPA
jgi:hypothetical protein